MTKEAWTISINPEIKKALKKYLDAELKGSSSAYIQELIKKDLKPKGYWPPKAKEGK